MAPLTESPIIVRETLAVFINSRDRWKRIRCDDRKVTKCSPPDLKDISDTYCCTQSSLPPEMDESWGWSARWQLIWLTHHRRAISKKETSNNNFSIYSHFYCICHGVTWWICADFLPVTPSSVTWWYPQRQSECPHEGEYLRNVFRDFERTSVASCLFLCFSFFLGLGNTEKVNVIFKLGSKGFLSVFQKSWFIKISSES